MEGTKFAVIGDKDKMLLFSLTGGVVYSPVGEQDTRVVLNKLCTKYKLIYIASSYARFVEDIIEDSKNATYPVITILPVNSFDTYATMHLQQDVKKFLGVELNFDEKV